ncbi:MAG: localization factor PodJL [Alphaproteobacteria bacterium]|nr:localization factor PodJL [Alphaproteobacteria bacterium]
MKLGIPWKVKSIRPNPHEAAREAAHRAGMSVGEWLNTVIHDSADEEGRGSPRGYNEHDGDQLFAVHERLNELTRQLERLHQPPAPRSPYPPAARGPEAYTPLSNRDRQLAEAIARLERRMDELVNASRAIPAEPGDGAPAYASPAPADITEPLAAAPADGWTPDVDQAMAEITARMQALDAEPDAPIFGAQSADTQPAAPMQPEVAAQPAPLPVQDLSGLEQQLRHITSQIEALRQQPQLEQGIADLQQALREVANTLLDAMPKRAIETLEGEVRALASRLDNSRHAGVDTNTLASIERGLAQVLETLHTLRPAETLDGFREAVHSLTQKIDMLGSSAPDPSAFQQLETNVSAMRGIANEALRQLTAEVHALAQKIEQGAAAGAGGADHSNALEILDQRVAHIADALESRVQNGGSVPPQLEALIQGLTDKIERLQDSRADDVAFGNLENRIAGLVEKFDASGARISQLEAVERGLADLLMHIENQRSAGAAAVAPQVDGLQRDLARTQSSLDAVHGTLGHVVDRLATLESDMRGTRSQPQPGPEAQPGPVPAAAQVEMQPAAGLPAVFAPRPPAEVSPPPSRAVAHAQATAAMARANPQAVRAPIDPNLPPDHPIEPGFSPQGGLTASPADRIAASEAALGPAGSAVADSGSTSNFIAAARRAAKAAAADPTTADLRAAASQQGSEDKAGKSLSQRVRSLFVGASVILIAGGGLRIATNLIDSVDTFSTTEIAGILEPSGAETKALTGEPQPVTAEPPTAPSSDVDSSPEATGSLQNSAPAASYTLPTWLNPSMLPSTPPAPSADKLPPAIGGPALRAAAAAGDASAEYEVGLRYAEGRGVTANASEAVRWLELAAKQGLAMAQFRLAGLYEKGIGGKKDIETARRLYKAAAEQGNAGAMHNLAVLYAEGAAVKPDYRTAAQWFRLAADHGVSDSQYNLAILYARGIGVDQNLVESYKWFALAAAQGDNEAAKKRDEVGKRLDPQSLATANLAVQSFVPQPQPEAATMLTLPVGGWDAASSTSMEPAPAKPKRNTSATTGSR